MRDFIVLRSVATCGLAYLHEPLAALALLRHAERWVGWGDGAAGAGFCRQRAKGKVGRVHPLASEWDVWVCWVSQPYMALGFFPFHVKIYICVNYSTSKKKQQFSEVVSHWLPEHVLLLGHWLAEFLPISSLVFSLKILLHVTQLLFRAKETCNLSPQLQLLRNWNGSRRHITATHYSY